MVSQGMALWWDLLFRSNIQPYRLSSLSLCLSGGSLVKGYAFREVCHCRPPLLKEMGHAKEIILVHCMCNKYKLLLTQEYKVEM